MKWNRLARSSTFEIEIMEIHFFQCPYCWSQISILLDPSISQTYVEDCEVCCNPIEFIVEFTNHELTYFMAKSLEQ